MPNRSSVAATITIVATLLSGTVAVAATVQRTIAASDDDRPAALAVAAPRSAGPTPAPAGEPAAGDADTTAPDRPSADPKVKFLLALSRSQTAAASAGGAPPASDGGGRRGSFPADTDDDDGSDTDHAAAPAPVPAPAPAPSTTTTAPAPYNCRGSDDGMSESYKHAREEWCHDHDSDD